MKSQDGALPLPQSPGLGVDLVRDEIAKHPSYCNVANAPLDDGHAYVQGTADEAMHVQTRRARAARMRI